MKQLVQFPLEAGGVVLVEIDEEEEGIDLAARPGEVAGRAAQTFDDALDRLRPLADAIATKLRAMSSRPDEIQVELGDR